MEVLPSERGMRGDGLAVEGICGFSVGDDGKSVVGGSESRLLDWGSQKVIDEGGFAGGMVA